MGSDGGGGSGDGGRSLSHCSCSSSHSSSPTRNMSAALMPARGHCFAPWPAHPHMAHIAGAGGVATGGTGEAVFESGEGEDSARAAWRSASLLWSSSILPTKTLMSRSWIATSCPGDTDPPTDCKGTGEVGVAAGRARSAVLEGSVGEDKTSLRAARGGVEGGGGSGGGSWEGGSDGGGSGDGGLGGGCADGGWVDEGGLSGGGSSGVGSSG